MIIFIDDLDRCLPTASLRLLEGIRIYLNLSNCILVFGMDHRQLEQSLLEALPWLDKEAGNASYYANEYLEKICQDIHQLPLPNKDEKAGYFKKLLNKLDNGNIEQQDSVHTQVLDQILQDFDCLPANPRKIKMLVNRVALMLRVIPPKQGEGDSDDYFTRQYKLLLIVAMIATFHKSLYEQLESNPGYILEVIRFGRSDGNQSEDVFFAPMVDVLPSRDTEGRRLPVNPSDSNVFRLHELINDLEPVTEEEILPYLRLKQ